MMVVGKLPDVANGSSRTVLSNVAGPDFFRTLGVPVLAGPQLVDSDTATSPHVGIINHQFAERFVPNQNPLGHIIGPDSGRYQMTIVGVVKDHICLMCLDCVGSRGSNPPLSARILESTTSILATPVATVS